MRRRRFLGLVFFVSLSAAGWCRADTKFDFDVALEWQGLKSDLALAEGRKCYQLWLNGQLDSLTAKSRLAKSKLELLQGHRTVLKLAAPELVPLLRAWGVEQAVEFEFLEAQVRSAQASRQSSQELQSRWLASLRTQRLWLQARRVRLPLLVKNSRSLKLKQYFQWRASLLELMEEELALAEALARGFLDKSGLLSNLVVRALRLHQRGQGVRPPAILHKAHQVFLERLAALARLSESAEAYLSDPSSDAASNLREDETRYSELVLRGNQQSLTTLSSLLSD